MIDLLLSPSNTVPIRIPGWVAGFCEKAAKTRDKHNMVRMKRKDSINLSAKIIIGNS
jgi:hypothetical protein